MRFSVVIPVYNRSFELKRALDSLRMQAFSDFEVIVVDDGSRTTFKTQIEEIVAEFSDLSITLLHHATNQNGAAARNTGIDNASGQFILFLDSDDIWTKEKLTTIETFLQNSRYSIDNCVMHHPYLNHINHQLQAPFPAKAKEREESVAHYSFVTNKIGGIQSSTIGVSATLCRQVKFDSRLTGHQDWDFCLRLEAAGAEFHFIPEPLSIRYHSETASVASSLDWRFSLSFLKQREHFFTALTKQAYLRNIVCRNAIARNEIPQLLTSIDAWKTGIAGLRMWPYWLQQLQQLRREQKRFDDLVERLPTKATNLILWGRNKYTTEFIVRYRKRFTFLCIIDRSASENEQLMEVHVLPINKIDDKDWSRCGAVILMTDRHGDSMQQELKNIKPDMLNKVFQL